MAASLENPYWRDVLKWGRRSASAPIFDNHWDRKLTLPVLSGSLEDAIRDGHGKLHWSAETAEVVFDYHGSHYPIDPSTYPLALKPALRTEELYRLAGAARPEDMDALNDCLRRQLDNQEIESSLVSRAEDIIALLENQPWQKIHWRDAAKGLSYRRFFEITGLVGVRVEDPAVFDTTHRLILDLVEEGRVQGLRVDHIDGLADPKGYLERLREAVGPEIYLVVEKILEGEEQLPADWPVEGTTGYEFIADLAGLLAAESEELDRGWEDVAAEFGTPQSELERAKRLMVEVNFEGEVSALVRQAQDIAKSENRSGISESMLAEAVRALVAGFEVYRTYGTPAGIGEQDRRVLERLFDRLHAAEPQLQPALSLLRDALLAEVGQGSRDGAALFRTRLQHLTGPVLAKSLEDTFFYRYNRLIALNEVGGDPIRQVSGIDHFHRRMSARNLAQPHALSTTSTHDTKRGEDARARLYAISEAPADWIALTARWRQEMSGHVVSLADGPAPEPAVEWLLFQALAGMLRHDFEPTSRSVREEVRERFLPYVEKALREAKLRTNWSDVNEPYEQAVKQYAAAAIDSEPFMARFWRDIAPFVRTGLVNSLTQTLVKLTAPGVPDIYQGTEGLDTSLVDPDNRRMPDYPGLVVPEHEPSPADFRAMKAWLIRRALSLRAHCPQLFAEGSYLPLESGGRRKENVLAFAREFDGDAVVVVVPRLVHSAVAADVLLSPEYWQDTILNLPAELPSLRDILSADGVRFHDKRLSVAELFRMRPFALLANRN